jgi:uncharacterized membrane protein SpoIIM required for sporulation
MRERAFVERQRAGWDRLEELLARVDRRGLRALEGDEIAELGRRYRAATTALATVQTRAYDPATLEYLNGLVARAHAYVYVGNAGGGWSRIAGFFCADFPREVRRSWRPIAVCAALFALATAVAYAAVIVRPQNAYALVPAQSIPLVQKSLHDSNFAVDSEFAPAMSTVIITNNIKVAAIAFAGGMTLGVLTLWAILNNGLMLGALGALFAAKGFGDDFVATVAPHGVIELTSIMISGGAGLLLAGAIVAPGPLRRADALKLQARRAATLLVGVAALLVVAGTIEGFFSPLRLPISARLGAGAFTAALLTIYLTTAPWPSRRGTHPSAQR